MKKKSAIESEKNISESDYINIIIIHNIDENQIFTAFSIKKLFSQIKSSNFNNICLSFHHLCNSPELFKNLKGNEYLGAIFYILLFVLEEESPKMNNLKEIFLNDIILLVGKLYSSKKLSNKDILLLTKFISFTSIHTRKAITQNNVDLLMSLSNSQIKNYSRLELAMKLIQQINNAQITYDFCLFLNRCFFNNKYNFSLFVEKIDILRFLFLNDNDNKIINFLTELYSFKYNRHFLSLFLNKISNVYDIKNKNINTIEILKDLNKSILFISQLKEKEDKKYEKDPYILSKAFYFDNKINIGIHIDNIQINNSLSIIFSFCLNSQKKINKQRISQNKINNKEYPIIYLIETGKGKINEKNGLLFSIKNGIFYLKNFFNDKKTEIINIEENQIYICCYSIKEKNYFCLQIFNRETELIKYKNKFTNELKKNMDIIVGKLNPSNSIFDGYIGPILIFKKYFEDIPPIFLSLKGGYEKALFYLRDYNTTAIDIYDKLKNKNKKIFEIKEDLSKYLLAYITPFEKEEKINKLYYYNTTFIETKISYDKEPIINEYNNYSIFEFIKYEGMNYLVLIFELITTNIHNMDNDLDKLSILNLFKNIINLIIKILEVININNFLDNMRCILFSIKKCIIELGNKNKLPQEIISDLKFLINFLTNQDTGKQDNNYILMRNEILKFILNIELYDTTNFSSMEYFLDSLNSSLKINSYGITSMDIFRKIMRFSSIYNQEKNILHDKNYKSFKHQMNSTLISYLIRSEKIQPYNELFQAFSTKYDFDYKNYQFFKIFYLSSQNFFSKENNKSIIPIIKYIIDLYEYLSNTDYTEMEISLKKEKIIIMALCLRFFFEYALIENIPKLKNKNNKQDVNDRITRYTIGPNNNNLISSLNDRYDLNDDLDIDNLNKSGKKLQLKDIIAVDDIEPEIDNSSNEHNSDNTGGSTDDKKSDNDINVIRRKNSDENILSKIKNKNIKENLYYYDYFELNNLIQKILSSSQFNDYCFKSIILFFLEKNNDINLEQKIKYKFIIKTKQYSDLYDKEFENFLKLKYFNEETKNLFLKLLDLIEKNNDKLGRISYEIMIYILIKIISERKNNECTFNHLISSRKIYSKLFSLCLLYNTDASQTLINEFQNILNLVIPYHTNHFLFSFLFECLKEENLYNYGIVFFNQLLKTKINKEENTKIYYMNKINCILFLYRIIKSKEEVINNKFLLEKNSLVDLFDIDLFSIKFNILKDISKSKKKTYVELLFEILIYFYIKTSNKIYFSAINDIFISNNSIKNIGDSKSILYRLDSDSFKPKNIKNNLIIKILKNFEIIEEKFYTLEILYKSLIYWIKSDSIDLRANIISLINNFFYDANLFYKENNTKLKKVKSKNELHLYIKELLEEYTTKNKYKTAKIDEISINFKAKYYDYQHKSNRKSNEQNNKKSLFNFLGNNSQFEDLEEDFEKTELNNSFSSCDSDKNIKEICKNNKKAKMKIKKKKIITTESELLTGEEETIINKTENYYNNINQNDNNENLNNDNNLNQMKKELNQVSNLSNKLNINDIDSPNKVILFPKLSLLEQTFSSYFTDIFFYNEPFINMKNYFKYRLKKNYQQEISIDNFFDFPIITRNYIPKNLYFGGLFIKHDLNFFANRYFHISHTYFINKAKDSKAKRIFKRISEQNYDIINFIEDITDIKNKKFIVDLVTNRSVYFGELIICKNLFYFHKLDKDKYFKDKNESEEEKYLLSSPLCDYSNKNKKLFIFKKEIIEIINRRFLYSFQACELYLKNGKSYYFNFYSEEKKIEFFSLFSDKKFNPYGIKIISDLKTEFRKKDFTNNWLNNKITTLEYLLFLNKYSCRSYNDINQYPVFPWLRIIGDKIRDLKNTIAAQTEDARMMLKEKYTLSSETFPFHYTTHYSNSSFLLYYLVRINPFTDNQITLQNNKFDSPARQFNSIDDLLKILSTTSQPREIIPEFFITTEFYYNYNCNFFGIKNKTYLINNLENKSGYDTPLDYILANACRLESAQCKSEINYFFDNIFGTGQMGGQDKCNTYDKYSYQEMIDLRAKIEKYKIKKLSLKEIKEKIDKKANKIISFGQTPFKLLEDKHPQWIDKDNNKINNIDNNNIIEASYLFSFPQKIIFIKATRNNTNKKYFYVLIHNPKEKYNNYELKFFEQNLKEDNSKNIKITKKIKFLQKLRLFQNNKNNKDIYLYKYNPRLLIIDFNMTIFIISRFNDSTLGLYNSKGETKLYLTESIITCISKTSENSFLTGHFNGKILEWKFIPKTMSNIILCDDNSSSNNLNLVLDELIVVRKFIAHKEKISGIYFSDLLGLIISSGDDNKIMIRKYYDLTLLTMIDFGINKFCNDIKISHCFLYILFFDESVKKHIVQVYSVNGLKVGEGNYSYINGINLDKIGNVFIGNFKENKIEIYCPSMTRKLDEIILENKIEKKSNKKLKKFEKNENINEINEKAYFTDFYYDNENNSIYACFSNGLITKVKYKCNYE